MLTHRSTTVNRKHIDGIAIVLISAIILTGGVATWQAYQQWRSSNEMGGHMGMDVPVHGPNPLWYLLGTIVAVSVVGAVYIALRTQIDSSTPTQNTAPVPSESDQTGPSAKRANEPGAASDSAPNRSILDLLPDDERRILEPVIDSPGLTQIELRDRSGFSKSKVSQTVTALEKRGLLYREPQGRTYRIYPSEKLEGSKVQRHHPDRT